MKKYVLVSWVAVKHDPYVRIKSGGAYDDSSGGLKVGPTLNLLFGEASPYRGLIDQIVFFYADDEMGRRVFEQTIQEISKKSNSDISIKGIKWKECQDPTDHKAIFSFLQPALKKLRSTKEYKNRELIINSSPGTPSMQTIWVLMGESGCIGEPFKLVKGYSKSDKPEGPSVVEFEVGLNTFYKIYSRTKPRIKASDAQSVFWDPNQFKSQKLVSVFHEAQRYADLKIPILILGERGTGKTSLAGWIRANSRFRKKELDNNWPSVACGQYDENLMRSELFGYLKGSFTGALDNKSGLLAAAHEDTLFLDEIGDISKELQRLLIRAVEEKTYVPLGAIKAYKSDFRLISATNRNLADLIPKVLDEDFVDRISTVKLTMPALRELPEDIPWLWDSVFDVACQRADIDTESINLPDKSRNKIINILQKHPLPGNLRDLFEVAYRLMAALNPKHEQKMASGDAVSYALECLKQKDLKQDNIETESDLSPKRIKRMTELFDEWDLIAEKLLLKWEKGEREGTSALANAKIAKALGKSEPSFLGQMHRYEKEGVYLLRKHPKKWQHIRQHKYYNEGV